MNLQIIQPTKFSCGRTCRPYIECRFGNIIRAVGRTKVVSHTTTVAVEYRNIEALGSAVVAMGGTVIGHGLHKLYQHTYHGGGIQGFGFQLPGWSYPCILEADGNLAMDTYNGAWGDVKDLDKLKGLYTIQAAAAAAFAEGWQIEYAGDGSLLIHHPEGGVLTVTAAGVFDASGFIGTSCDAVNVISSAVGTQLTRDDKCEYFQQAAQIVAGE